MYICSSNLLIEVEISSGVSFLILKGFTTFNLSPSTPAESLNEFIKTAKPDAVIVSIGGGGLISGVASAIKMMNPKCKIFGVEPEGANSMYTSFIEGKPIQNANTDTIVDSLAPPMTLPFSYEVCKKYVCLENSCHFC